MPRTKKKFPLSIGACIGFSLFSLIFIIYIISKFSYGFADFINSTVSAGYRFIMAKFGDLFPFSLYELIIILIPMFAVVFLIVAYYRFKSGVGWLRFTLNVLAVCLVVYAGHLLALGIGYNTTPLANKLQLSSVEVTEDNLASTLVILRNEANELSLDLALNEDGSTSSGLTLEEASALICEAYADFSEKQGFPASFDSSAKGILNSNVMSYFSLGGIYTFYTGEANVNTLYPDYDVIFTAAHELSHQRGILRENEANFMAYLVLSGSDNIYLRYSAALSLYGYVSSALYRTSPERYREIASGLSAIPRADLLASAAVPEKYGNTIFSDISRTVNDLFLKSSGTEGVVSYGLVTRLAVAYFSGKEA